MLILASTVFLYYTIWTLLMVRSLRLSLGNDSLTPHDRSPSSTTLILCNRCFPHAFGPFGYPSSSSYSVGLWWAAF